MRDGFNSISISILFVSKSELSSTEHSLEILCYINEKDNIIKIIFLREFLQKSSINVVVVVEYSRIWSILFNY